MASKRVLVLFGEFYYHETHRGMAEYALQHKWQLYLSTQPPSSRTWQGDGIIANTHAMSKKFLDFLDRQTIPVAKIMIQPHESVVPTVSIDNFEIGRLAARHFMTKGFRNFAF